MTPCGQIVAYLRNCYSTKFKFFNGDLDRESDVTWYRPDPDAGVLYDRTLFSSSIGLEVQGEGSGDYLGEQRDVTRVWYNGAPLEDYPGLCSCTPADYWLDGSPGPGSVDFDRDACCDSCFCESEDTFTDADGTALTDHVMNNGPGWTVGSFTQLRGIFSDHAADGNTTAGAAQNLTETGMADCVIEADLFTGVAKPDQGLGFCFRWSDNNNGYIVALINNNSPPNNKILYWRMVSGTINELTLFDFSTSENTLYHLKLVLSGNDFELFVDGTSVWTLSRSHNNTATRHGLTGGSSATGARTYWFDNWCVHTPGP